MVAEYHKLMNDYQRLVSGAEDYLIELRRFNDNLEALRMLSLGEVIEAILDLREMAIPLLGYKDKGLG